ncbi:uncharacterized protein CDV56_106626 [Aspergillus thermomutatus]|uniref:Hydrophobin n=1 Tax=Aspergillus thermomutatus TaxID=41047 RepID=A0A397GZ66_ASPTH|nr:uncharacterized protein CDV56_106626 [Aspergillus thermomutatus]RHZ54686.1 hypothetical protein CDV56_106626 [Aspergillus thermomutatus]
MRPLTILSVLTTLSATLAVPFSHASSSSSASKSTPSSTRPASLPSPTLSPPNACPPKKSKQCCATLSEFQDGLLQPLGVVVPLLSGIQMNSILGLSCKGMADTAPETDCADAVMCCDSSAVLSTELADSVLSQGTENIMQTSCEDFEIAKKHEREAIERQQRRFSAMERMMMSQSATPSPTPVGRMRSSVSGAMATPTKV